MSYNYRVEVLRSGQPRAYADSQSEYLVTVTYTPDWGENRTSRPWWPIAEAATPAETRARDRAWCLSVARALCGVFREPGDDDGRTGMEAHFYPTLRSLTWDRKAGTIRVLIVSAYTD